MTEKIKLNYNFNSKKIVEISNWAKGIEFSDRNDAAKRDFTILYSGNMGLAHDFSCLSYLVRKLKNVNGIKYIFSGGGKKKAYLQSLFTLNGEKRVIFNKYVERRELPEILAQGDLLVIAQTAQTVGDILPSKLYSYLASGKPVLFFGPKESEIGMLLIKHDIGIVCESGDDVKKVYDYILTLKAHPQIVRKTGERARKVFEQCFTLEKSVSKFENILKYS